jgi:hypothetical protein
MSQVPTHEPPVLAILDHHFTGRVRNGRPAGVGVTTHHSWKRIRHATTGGVTDFCGLFCSAHTDVEPNVSTLPQSLLHILGYGCRPQYASDPSLSTNCASYLPEDRLQLGNFAKPLFYHTLFFASRWGFRSLAPPELIARWGYLVLRLHCLLTRFPYCPSALWKRRFNLYVLPRPVALSGDASLRQLRPSRVRDTSYLPSGRQL